MANTYDTASRLSTLTYNGTQHAGDIVYNASDQTTEIKVGAAGTNQITEQYTFDPQTGLLSNQKAIRNSTELLNLSYEYNRGGSVGSLNGKTGHLTKIIDNLNTNKNREYEFDALGRLTKAKGGTTGTLWNQTYTYDRYGNRTNVTASGTAADSSPIPLDGVPSLTYQDTTNRITTSGYDYDVAGNQTKGFAADGSTALTYEYDAANRVRVVRKDNNQTDVQAFVYGSTNARLIDYDAVGTGFNSFYCSVGGTVMAEYTEVYGTFTWMKSSVYLGDRLLSTASAAGGSELVEFSHPDRLGTRVVSNQAGNSYEQATLPFGTALNAESTLTNSNKRFTSYDRSPSTGLDYAINRTYDSKLGRFTQVDPIGINASSVDNPQTLNLYTYCSNDPINRTDPDGLFWGSLFKKIGKFFSKIGRAINKILSHIAVRVALIVLAAVVTLGMAAVAAVSIFAPTLVAPTWLVIATYASTALSWASKIGSALELTGLLLQGKFKQLGKIIGIAFVGALVGVIEDSIVNGSLSAWSSGKSLLGGAWRGFKTGLRNVWAALKRFGSKKWWEGFMPLYGFFCSPGWGVGNATENETPVDSRDSACQRHDSDLAQRDRDILNGLSVRTKTYYDVGIILRSLVATSRPRFVDLAFGSGGRIGDRFGFTVPFAFGIRIAKNRGR